MREIKFRGKRKDSYNHEWVYGSYMDSYFSSRYGLVTAIFFNNYEICKTFRIPVFKNTVGQFTGLKDKNGVEIYEGDIVKFKFCRKEINAEIKFGEYLESKYDKYDCTHYGYYLDYKYFNYCDNTGKDLNDINSMCEVIGNIYDNPELLENT